MSPPGSAGRHGRMRAVRLAVILGCLAALLPTAGASAPAEGWNQETIYSHPAFDTWKAHVNLYGGDATFTIARVLRMTKVMGKELNANGDRGGSSSSGPITDQPPRSANNFSIRDFPNVHENEPSLAVNPSNASRLVAGTHFIAQGNRCVAHYSRDGGKSWSARPIFMPQLTHQAACSDPVLAYAPDGSRVYYAYMDIKSTSTFEDPILTLTQDLDILVTYSDDDGKSWKGPVVALNGDPSSIIINFETFEQTFEPGFDYDKPWIGTHVPGGGGSSNWVYITATLFESNFSDDPLVSDECRIEFARSSTKGTSWGAPTTLDSSGSTCGDPVAVQGSRPVGGRGSDVLVAWYHSGADPWLEGGFAIRTRYSSNRGATFGPIVQAASDQFELPFFLGPDFKYHRWWGGMFPDVEIAPNGSGHVAYIHDPVAGSATDEDGDARYIRSAGRPYSSWSAPVTVNDDGTPGKAQGWVALEATSDSAYAMWEDHRRSTTDNLNYDVFWSRKGGSGGWSSNRKLTDASSTSDFIFLGDYYDLAVADGDDGDDLLDHHDDGPFVYGVWTDRRDEPSEFDFDDDIWGAELTN